MDAKVFMEALDEIEATKGISKSSIIEALKEALKKALEKNLFGGAYEGSDIRVEISEDPASIDMKYVRKVVEGEVEDDFLEISVEDANKGKKGKKYVAGDEYVQQIKPEEMARLTALTVKSVLRQKLAEAEKQSLYESHKDKIGEMITGIVEKCDDRGAIVNIGRTSLYLTRKELIGDEMFDTGAPIRLYVSDVSSGDQGKSPMVKVSRSDPGFLRRLFEEEVREIYDGTVIIKSLAREAGIRSKIAVYSNDPNVDSVGCCIGVNGSAIQKIVGQLGNARDKEKIDIISYSPNDYLFIIDALRPASVLKLGIYTAEDGRKCAIAIVPDGQSSLAIGRKGANVRVACKLTGYKIDILEESHEADAKEIYADIVLKSVEQVQQEEKERAQKEKYENYLAKIKASRQEEVKTEAGVEKAKPQKILDEEVEEVKEEVKPVEEVKTEPVKEEVKEEVKPTVKPTVVKTTTTLASLEASLESDKKKEEFKATQKTSKRPRKITEDEVANEEKKEEVKKVAQPQMDIYTKEELEELDNEELYEDDYYDDEEDIDFDDFDKYYDDEN
jgi:N utilization substance protein A